MSTKKPQDAIEIAAGLSNHGRPHDAFDVLVREVEDLRKKLVQAVDCVRPAMEYLESGLKEHPKKCGCEPEVNWWQPECLIVSSFHQFIDAAGAQGEENAKGT